MDPSCRERLLQTIGQHPDGLLVQTLLAEAGEPGERLRMLNALRGLILSGHVAMAGKNIASAWIRPAAGR